MIKNKLLIVVDMQNDFLFDALKNKVGAALIPQMQDKIREYMEDGYEVVFTRDTHAYNYMETEEGKNLPVPHCIKGTHGWEIVDSLKEFVTEDTKVFDKVTFGSDGIYKYLETYGHKFDEIELIGVCTDICVISNALILKSLLPEIDVYVYDDLCAGLSPEAHEAALTVMKDCQIIVKKYFE
jgi:nicotinamidase-related amidase